MRTESSPPTTMTELFTAFTFKTLVDHLSTHPVHHKQKVEGGLLVKALDCGSKGPGFQSHLQQRFISLLGALSPTPKIEQKVYLHVLRRGH